MDEDLERAVLGGEDDEKERAAETILTKHTTPELLENIFWSFPEGDYARRAWALLEKHTVEASMLQRILGEVTERAIAEAVFDRLAALDPSESDISWAMTSTKVQSVKNRAAAALLARGVSDVERLDSILHACDVAELCDEAARRLLPQATKGEHFLAIVRHAHDPQIVDAAWKRCEKLSFKKDWDRIGLRNVIAYHRDAKRRSLALDLAIAKKVAFDDVDMKQIRAKIKKDPRVKKLVTA